MRDTLDILGRVPVVAITGDKDRLVSPSLGLELAEAIPSAELVRVPGAGHALILEAPEVVNEAITGLIARVDAGAAARERTA
jgi:pimeloyl-ACP methyl ester carboxylesterase